MGRCGQATPQECATRNKSYIDRSIDSLLNGYQSTRQFVDTSMPYFGSNDLHDRACFLLSHYELLRGENTRDPELTDTTSQLLDGEGSSESVALVLLIQQGKTNQYEKLQHVRYMKNRDVKVCPVGAETMYIFTRFHIDKECFPDFQCTEA